MLLDCGVDATATESPQAPKTLVKETMANGWQRFAPTLAGFLIAKSDAVGRIAQPERGGQGARP